MRNTEQRLSTFRDGRYAAHLVTESDGTARWYVWDLRATDPWWLPEGKIDDAPELNAEIVLNRWLLIAAEPASD